MAAGGILAGEHADGNYLLNTANRMPLQQRDHLGALGHSMSADSFKSCASSSPPAATSGSPAHAHYETSPVISGGRLTNASSEGRVLYELPEESPPTSPLICSRRHQDETARALPGASSKCNAQLKQPEQQQAGSGRVEDAVSFARKFSMPSVNKSSSSFKRLWHGLGGRRSSRDGGSDRIRMNKIQEQIRRLSGQQERPLGAAAMGTPHSEEEAAAATAQGATRSSCSGTSNNRLPEEGTGARDWSRYLREWEAIERASAPEPPLRQRSNDTRPQESSSSSSGFHGSSFAAATPSCERTHSTPTCDH